MDGAVGLDKIMRLQTHQRINHFHGMLELCRKNSMARNLSRIRKELPYSFNFFPRCRVMQFAFLSLCKVGHHRRHAH